MAERWGLSPHLLNQTAPFHLVLGQDGMIRQVGRTLQRLCAELCLGRAWNEVLTVISPRGTVDWDFLTSRERALFVLEIDGCDLTLRGQMVHEPGTDVVIFVGSPWITDLGAVSALGLTLDDFSVADSIVDYLLLLQTQNAALEQSRTLAEELHTVASQLKDRAQRLELLTRERELVLNSAGEGICGLNAAGAVTFANDAAGRLLRLDPADMLGRNAADLIRIESGDGARVDLSAGQDVRQLSGRCPRADGSAFDAELVAAPILDDGVPLGTVIVVRDVSERNAVDRMKSEFMSLVSHELRTPLTSIQGALGLLDAGAAGALEPRAGRLVELARISSERLMLLINDMLDVEGMATGKLTLNLQRVEASTLVHAATSEMAGLAAAAGVLLRTRTAEGSVMADADRVVHTLNNLLGNAVKFSEPGSSVELAATIDGSHVRFDVRDTGPGIPPGQLEMIFEPFHQGDASDTRSQGGSGLGLAICRGLVEGHGGRIWAANADPGTLVSFTLPMPTGARHR